MPMDRKEKRNKQILLMHNAGSTTQAIATKYNLSKAGVHGIIKSMLPANDVQKEPEAIVTSKVKETAPVATSKKGERVFNFGEYQRTGVNQYAHKSTGECIIVSFVPASSSDSFGYFVKV
jgi:hypothetical protein